MRPALVILAAGASTRLSRCKGLVDLGGATPLQRLCRAGAALGPEPVLVVAGADHSAIAEALPEGCELVHNRDWALGRTGGVQLAVRRRPGRDLCLAPADVPLVPARVFEALARAWARGGPPERGWLSPAWEGRHGHPVVVGRGLLAELAGFSPDRPLRELRDRADPLLDLAVDAPEILDDLDTPEDLAELRRRLEPE